jgi:hypothetical protein
MNGAMNGIVESRDSTEGGLLNSSVQQAINNQGPLIATVVDHLDSGKNGALKVVLHKGTAKGQDYSDMVHVTAEYLPMFFGQTSYDAMDPNNRNSNSSQASYGMWFVPPDVGTQVVVIFIENKMSNRCFWIGCVPQPGINHMVPGLASTKAVELTPQEKTRLGADDIPSMEANRRLKGERIDQIDTVKRPLHPFALRLATQGLLKDPIRGTTTASARRAEISNVYGISTPGPVKVNGKKYKVGPKDNKFDVYAEREGGTQFVMDDGYISKDQQTGKEGILDEHVRIRTRTGHQILLHNSSDLIYICNSRGTAWMEFTSDGKIDVFAADSVSVHTQYDFNFRADRNINMEAGNNINMVATRGSVHLEAGGIIGGFAGVDCNWTAKSHVNLNCGGRIRLTAQVNPINPLNSGIDISALTGNINMYATTDCKIQSLLDFNIKSGLGLTVISGAATTFKTVGEFVVSTGGANYISAGGANVFSALGAHIERATLIDMNGPTPAPESASSTTNLKLALDALTLIPEPATVEAVLDTFELPYREADRNATETMQKGWENNNYYRQPNIRSIMKRVPTHEPWDHHESIAPAQFVPLKTDRDGNIAQSV